MSPLFGGRGGGSEPRRERSAAERERDRLEREARRARREGRPEPEAPDAAEPAPRDTEPEPESPAPRPAAPAPAPEPEPEPEPRTEERDPAAPQPGPPAPEPPARAATPQPPAPSPRAPLAWDDAAPDGDDEHDHHHDTAVTVIGREETPLGTKRVAASSLATAAGAEGPPRFGAPPSRPHRARRRRLRRLLGLAGLIVLVLFAWFLNSLFQPFKGDGHGSVRVSIPAGSSAGDIGDILAERGVVDSGFFFGLRARLSGKRGDLRSGDHVLAKDMSYGAAIDALTTTPAPPKMVKVTIPEGRSAREIVPSVRRAGLRGGYLKATRDRGLLNPRDYGAPKGTRTLEGFLWPATYELKPGATARSLVKQQVDAFRENLAAVSLKRARRKNLTRYDVITIASMIEREALVPKDRRLIAAVIYNRLHERMPLGIDATIRYRLNNWSRPLTNSDLRGAGAYNTRLHTGLPPTPIGNPGLASLKAAANPAHVSYLFYVVKPCGEGAHKFSSTDAQFQRDVAAYNRARDARGGKDPSRC